MYLKSGIKDQNQPNRLSEPFNQYGLDMTILGNFTYNLENNV